MRGRATSPFPALAMPLRTRFAAFVFALLAAATSVLAQPSPQVQKRISAAIKTAANATSDIDYTQFVNVFIGTDNDGDVWYVARVQSTYNRY